MSKVLVTGGAGYIGSHTAVEILSNGDEVVIVDNLSNSSRLAVERIEQITGKTVRFHEVDLRDRNALREVFDEHNIDSVIHFAGLKAVGESTEKPIEYYENNIGSSLSLLSVMRDNEVFSIVFSSSATVYGDPDRVPITEDMPANKATNPYGWSKVMIEQILQDTAASDERWNISILRYFNPIGAHESGLIGEDPKGIPNNLMPFISQVAVGKRDELSVFGDDYDTPDGTGVRDYIHVVDLSRGHLAALKHIKPGVMIHNLGTGKGTSVLGLTAAFKEATKQEIPYKIVDRRPGDIAECYADCSKANSELGWSAKMSIEDCCKDSWRWQSNNPDGYGQK